MIRTAPITRVSTVYGGHVHVATADLETPARTLLPLYNRHGQLRSDTEAGMRAERRGDVLQIARSNIGPKTPKAERLRMIEDLFDVAAASRPSHPRMMAAALLIASLAALQPARAQYSAGEWRAQQQIDQLREQQDADRFQYQLDQSRQQIRNDQRDLDAYEAHQDSLTRHYRSLGD